MNPGRLFILAPPLNSEWHRSPRYLRPHGRVERVGASRTRVGGARALHCGDPSAPHRGAEPAWPRTGDSGQGLLTGVGFLSEMIKKKIFWKEVVVTIAQLRIYTENR